VFGGARCARSLASASSNAPVTRGLTGGTGGADTTGGWPAAFALTGIESTTTGGGGALIPMSRLSITERDGAPISPSAQAASMDTGSGARATILDTSVAIAVLSRSRPME
jgi:hypothetical protein